MKVYVDGQLVGVFRKRPDGRYQRRIHSRVYTRDDLHAWVERMNRRTSGRARWRIEDTNTDGHYLMACLSGVNANRDLDVLMAWGTPRRDDRVSRFSGPLSR